MDESIRQQYLESMGIQAYFPRFVLPGAAPSPHYVSTLRQDAIAEAEPVMREALESKIPAEARRPETARQQQTAVVPEQPASAPARDASPGAEEKRFQVAFVVVGEDAMALASVPYMQQGSGLNQAQQVLLHNVCRAVCRALTLTVTPLSFGIKSFRWPFSEAAHVEKSEEAARTALQAYLSQLRHEHGFNRILIFGEQIATLIDSHEDCKISNCRSLDEMLRMPQLKREVWITLNSSLHR